MGLFGKAGSHKEANASIALFKEVIKDTDELYEELKAEYDALETVIEDFHDFIAALAPKLDTETLTSLEDFAAKLGKLDTCTRNSVRDLRDILRNQKKMLKELSN